VAGLESDQSIVGNGNPVRVATHVVEHLLRAAERGLGVQHPLGLARGRQVREERATLGQRAQRPAEAEPPGVEGFFEVPEKEAAE